MEQVLPERQAARALSLTLHAILHPIHLNHAS
jgi:hypothetical protein